VQSPHPRSKRQRCRCSCVCRVPVVVWASVNFRARISPAMKHEGQGRKEGRKEGRGGGSGEGRRERNNATSITSAPSAMSAAFFGPHHTSIRVSYFLHSSAFFLLLGSVQSAYALFRTSRPLIFRKLMAFSSAPGGWFSESTKSAIWQFEALLIPLRCASPFALAALPRLLAALWLLGEKSISEVGLTFSGQLAKGWWVRKEGRKGKRLGRTGKEGKQISHTIKEGGKEGH
jgi:hypothetical protein